MHDNAPAHRAAITTQFLQLSNITMLNLWPAHSPDLNPIQHLWDMLDGCVQGRQNKPHTFPQLGQAFHEELNNFH